MSMPSLPTTTADPTDRGEPSTPFIRDYSSADFTGVVHVFRETCDASLKTEPIWTIASFIWCRPYLLLGNTTCFVLDDGRGEVVGYIIGTGDTARFCQSWRPQYLPAIEHDLGHFMPLPTKDEVALATLNHRRDALVEQIRNNPEQLVYGSLAAYLTNYPGHLHIDILPSYQRSGSGRQLMNKFLAAIAAEGCTGVYLAMAASNVAAGAFYEACDFQRLPYVLDEGFSGELGRTAIAADGSATIYFVQQLNDRS